MSQGWSIAFVVFLCVATILPFAWFILKSSGSYRRRRMRDPVAGQIVIISASVPNAEASRSNCRITGVVSAPGIEPTPVKDHAMFKASKWPQPGQTLPVTVDRANPRLFTIEFDRIATDGDRAFAMAEELAAKMRADGRRTDREG